MNEEFYKNFIDDLVKKIPGLWYNAFTLEGSHDFYDWGVEQSNRENYREDYIGCRTKPCHKSYLELAEDILQYLKVDIK